MTDKNLKHVVLINPPGLHITPYGIFTMAAVIRDAGYIVDIIDGATENIYKKLRKLKNKILVCGITACTDNIVSAYEVADFIKNRISRDMICVIGGVHATILSQQTLKESQFDIAVEGEGEITFLEIIKSLEKGQFPTKVKGSYEKINNSKIIYNGTRDFIKNLDELPYPAFDLIDIKHQFHHIRLHKEVNNRVIVIMGSRGCPFNCPFCSSDLIWHRKLRVHSVDYVINFIKYLIEKYNIKGIHFFDDDFLINKKRAREFCKKFKASGLSKKIVWSCQGRSNSIDRSILEEIKSAGCILVRIGLESGSKNSLKFLKNNTTTVEDNYKAVNLCNKVKINVAGTFIIGSPDETLDDILDTVNFIINVDFNNVDVIIAIPYPCTQIFNICKERGYLRKELYWSDFVPYHDGTMKEPLIRNKYFSAIQLLNIRNYIYLYVVDYVKHGKKVPKRDFKKELEQIIDGDLTLLQLSLKTKIKSILLFVKWRFIRKAFHNPKSSLRLLLYALGLKKIASKISK